MGGNFSQPIPVLSDTGGYVCIVLRTFNKVRLLYAPRDVQDLVQRVVTEMHQGQSERPSKDSHGALQFYLPGRPFILQSGGNNATLGKLFAIRIFEEMHALGYNLVCSSDLSRMQDHSTWYFVKNRANNSPQLVVCIAPGGLDKLIVLRGQDSVVQTVKESIQATWTDGIQNEAKKTVMQQEVYEFKLRGNPWYGEGRDGNNCRLLIKDLVARLGRNRWRLLVSTNLKGGSDSLFFIRDENHSGHNNGLAILSLNRLDRIRLFNFESDIESLVQQCIMTYYQYKEPDRRQYHDAVEFKLKGTPFQASGDKAIATRKLICHLLEALRAKGWDNLETVDISRKVNDKSFFLLHKCVPANLKLACISLTSHNHMRFVNFPPETAQSLRNTVSELYLPGISQEKVTDETLYELVLYGSPWSRNSSYNLHGRSLILLLLSHCARLDWHFKSSADVSAKFIKPKNQPAYPLDVHSLFFCHFPSGTETEGAGQMPFNLGTSWDTYGMPSGTSAYNEYR